MTHRTNTEPKLVSVIVLGHVETTGRFSGTIQLSGLQKYEIEGGTVPPSNSIIKLEVGSIFCKKLEVGSQFYKMLEVGRQLCKKLEAAGQLFKKLEVRNQNVAYLVAQMYHLIFID